MKFKVIYLNKQPVNALSSNVRASILTLLNKYSNDKTVDGIIIEGKGSMFCGGADIKEFDNGKFSKSPIIHELIEHLARCKKPTIALMHGMVLGGGAELAMGCQYRVCLDTTMFGLPEINLGLLPAGGGTQLLPRLVGVDCAMRILTSNRHYTAQEALRCGAVDYVGKTRRELLRHCERICTAHTMPRCLMDKPVPDRFEVDEIFARHAARVERRSRGAVAPMECLKLAALACRLSFVKGAEAETNTFLRLVKGAQSRSMRYVFFEERALKRWRTKDGISAATAQAQPVHKCGVIGLGTMGATIAICFLQIGMPVYVIDSDEDRTDQGIGYIALMLGGLVQGGRASEEQTDRWMANVHKCTSYQDMKDCDLVIEAVFEDMGLKREVLAGLDAACKPQCVIATNTSTLDIDQLASATRRPDKVLGMHFFAPAHRMRLLENVRGRLTSPQTLATAMAVGFRLRKSTILVGNCTGFVVNRMYAPFLLESEFLLEEGAYPEQVDEALRAFGFPMGRFEVTDVAGNDVGYRVRETQGLLCRQQKPGQSDRIRKGYRYSPLTELIVEAGRKGYKSDMRGWFVYDAPFTPPRVDPEVTALIDDYRRKHRITPRHISQKEILERMLLCMVNEGFKLLHEHIASGPGDVDVAWINGMGWPKHTGGPMFYASNLGLPKVLEMIRERWERSRHREKHWEPSQMLINLVKSHKNPSIKSWMELSDEQDVITKAEGYVKLIAASAKEWSGKCGADADSYREAAPRQIGKIAVVGADERGCSIACCCARYGVPVVLVDSSTAKLRQNMNHVYMLLRGVRDLRNIQGGETSGAGNSKSVTELVKPHADFRQLQSCDLVIEAVPDLMEAKKAAYEQINHHCRPSTVVATATTLMSVTDISALMQRPEQLVGMHFHMPAHKIELLETVEGARTSREAVATAMAVGARLDKLPVLVRDHPGFVLERMFDVFLQESEFLLEEGCYPKQVDEVLKDFGFTMGRFEITDAQGNECGYKIERSYAEMQDPDYDPRKETRRRSRLTEWLLRMGRFGYKSAFRGWYRYFNNQVPMPDDEVRTMIEHYREKRGIATRQIPEREIFRRMIFCVVNEGFKCLEEGVARSPYDIDVAWLHGVFWPKKFGGPMYYAESFGLRNSLKRIKSRWETVGEYEPIWKPSKLLSDLVNKHNCPPMAEWTNYIPKKSKKTAAAAATLK